MSLGNKVQALLARAKNMKRPKPQTLSSSVVRHDRLDEGVLDDIRERARNFEPAFEPPMVDTPIDVENFDPDSGDDLKFEERPYDPWADLASDVFYGFHTYDPPEISPQEKVKPSRQLHRAIMEKIVHSDAFAATRASTRHDSVSSALATLDLMDELRELVESELVEQAVRAQSMAQQEQVIEEKTTANDDIRDQIKQQGGQMTPEQREEMRKNAQARANAQHQLDQDAQAQRQQGLGLNASQAIEDAMRDAQDSVEQSPGGYGIGSGVDGDLPPDQALELARRIKDDPIISKVMKLYGRLERDMRYQRSHRVVGGREEIVDVEVGNDLTRVLPSELVKLADPDLEDDFILRFYEGSLLQYDMVGMSEAGNGPITVALDRSGSMAGPNNEWARAVSLAMVSLAHREGRSAAIVEFDHGPTDSWYFPAKKGLDPAKIIAFASNAPRGGTDITLGVRECRKIIEREPDFNRADLVVITDGQCALDQEDLDHRDALHAMGVRLHGVPIGMRETAWTNEMCDTNVAAFDMLGASETTTHLAQTLT
jgi:uncharacterized protein with von Willebrand factor type A (vWA) domain